MTLLSYDRYSQWKQWTSSDFLTVTAHEKLYFDGEFKDLKLSGARVLEIGFGNGNFLRYALDRGANVSGTEFLAQSVTNAQQRGIPIYQTDLSDALQRSSGDFDLIVAFDVFEHMASTQIVDIFGKLELLLKPGGHVIARFPNGQSPLGRAPQYSDHTHRAVLSAPLLMHLLVGRPWCLVWARNPFMVVREGGYFKQIGLRLRQLSRQIIEVAVNRLYGIEITLDPNVTVLMRRT
jgi:2-polyprenyl-3-methyl-5-hydroxy-6-metoxy-1,4-benzoquinol methylase